LASEYYIPNPKMRRSVIVLIILLVCASRIYASHIFGGELLYTHDSLNSYKITLTLYGDCKGASFPNLPGSVPRILIQNGNVFVDSVLLNIETANSNIEVSPVCPSQLDSTTCHGGKLPGVKKFVYSNHFILPFASSNWQFIFDGNMEAGGFAGRSSAITNIYNPSGTSIMYLVATLNNISAPNNSPYYTTIPTPFYCVNITQQYNQGCNDIDGDSLSYSLTSALDGSGKVSYTFPYSDSTPMSADTFSFNYLNGQLIFKANAAQDALIVTRVSEYRHGVLVGTSMREMTFVILSNCNTTPPLANIYSITGGNNKGNTITVCQGISDLDFKISAYDSSIDTIIATPVSVPGSATLNIANNNTTNPQLDFSWHTAAIPTGVYNFFVTYKNNHCPLSSTQTIAYTIIIVPPYTASATVLAPTQCLHQAYVQLNIAGGVLPRTVILKEGALTVKTYIDSVGIIRDSLAAGAYTAIINNDNGTCPVYYSFVIPDSGLLPQPYTHPLVYCRYNTSSPIQLNIIDSSTVQWYDANKTPIMHAPTPSTINPGIFIWYVSEHYKTCSIFFDTVAVMVHDLPAITILNKEATACYGDKIYLDATGGIKYKWETTSNKIVTEKDGRLFSLLIDTVTYTVVATDENNCVDSASSSYSDIQKCCLFSYPNAFTPNGDGRNDRFRVITYGNMENYELSIYDRWGQRVFTTTDPYTGWDGNYHGQPCEIGTYFYLLRATCLTGHYEEQKGDITLIR